MSSKPFWVIVFAFSLFVLPAMTIKVPIKQEEITVSHLDIEQGYDRWMDYLRWYKDIAGVDMNFSEFDYNQIDYVGEGMHLMPGLG